MNRILLALITLFFIFTQNLPAKTGARVSTGPSSFVLKNSGLLNASVVPPAAPTPIAIKDPKALEILRQSLSNTWGASAIGDVQSFTATGTVINYWGVGDVSGTITIKSHGLDQYRVDEALTGGNLSFAVSHGSGTYKRLDGSKTPIPGHNTESIGSLTFPLLKLKLAIEANDLQLQYLGVELAEGASAHHIRVQQQFSKDRDPDGLLMHLSTRDLFFDSTTLLLSKIADQIHPNNSSRIDLEHSVSFADYRPVNGVLVPFSITEKCQKQLTWSMALSSVLLNSSLNDSDFDIN